MIFLHRFSWREEDRETWRKRLWVDINSFTHTWHPGTQNHRSVFLTHTKWICLKGFYAFRYAITFRHLIFQMSSFQRQYAVAVCYVLGTSIDLLFVCSLCKYKVYTTHETYINNSTNGNNKRYDLMRCFCDFSFF